MNELEKKYAESLASLIRCETVSELGVLNKEKFEKFHELLKVTFPNLFAIMEIENFEGSLLMKWKGSTDKEPLLLLSHHDVVPVFGEWKYPPFSGEIAEGKVWGRGTIDTKDNLWAMLQAADELVAEGYVPERDVYFESACTEETDGHGADIITAELKKRGIKFCMTLDEGGMVSYGGPLNIQTKKYAMIGVAEKPMVNLKFTAKSHGGHASTPGKNTPLVRLGKFMAAVEDGDIFKAQMTQVAEEMCRRLIPDAPEELRDKLANPAEHLEELSKKLPSVFAAECAMLKTTVAFTMAEGSSAANVLPSAAYVIGNMRVSHHQGIESSIKQIADLAASFDIETEVIQQGVESSVSDCHSEVFGKLEGLINEMFPDVAVMPYLMTGGSDSRFFSRVSDNCLRFAPFTVDMQQIMSIHGINENVNVSDLPKAVEFYKKLIKLI